MHRSCPAAAKSRPPIQVPRGTTYRCSKVNHPMPIMPTLQLYRYARPIDRRNSVQAAEERETIAWEAARTCTPSRGRDGSPKIMAVDRLNGKNRLAHLPIHESQYAPLVHTLLPPPTSPSGRPASPRGRASHVSSHLDGRHPTPLYGLRWGLRRVHALK